VIVGHSGDDSKNVVDSFIKNGAEVFEKKPIGYQSLYNIIDFYNPNKISQLNNI
jgi:hypothetical protein